MERGQIRQQRKILRQGKEARFFPLGRRKSLRPASFASTIALQKT